MSGNHFKAGAEAVAAVRYERHQSFSRQIVLGQEGPDDGRSGHSPDRKAEEHGFVGWQIRHGRLQRRLISPLPFILGLCDLGLIILWVGIQWHDREQRRISLARYPTYPDISVELIVDYGLTDIVAEGYDAGVRLGEQVAKDMIAVRIGPEMRMAVVGSPAYFKKNPPPQTPQDLTSHNCINVRLPTYGGLFPWGLEKDGREVKVRGEGQLVFNNLGLRLHSALDGLGIAYLPEDQVLGHVTRGRLVRVLEDWCPSFPGYHLYYPSRRHSSPALTLLIERLRYRRRPP